VILEILNPNSLLTEISLGSKQRSHAITTSTGANDDRVNSMENMNVNAAYELSRIDMLCLSLKKGSACVRTINGRETTCKSSVCIENKNQHLDHHTTYAERIKEGDWRGAFAHRERCIAGYATDVATALMESSTQRMLDLYREEVARALRSRQAIEAHERASEQLASIAGLTLEDLEATHNANEYASGAGVGEDYPDEDLLEEHVPIQKSVADLIDGIEKLKTCA
jgi:hypothetical protein